MQAIETRCAEHLNDFLIKIARCIQMVDDDVAAGIDERQIEQRQHVVVFEPRLVEEVLDVADVSQPARR